MANSTSHSLAAAKARLSSLIGRSSLNQTTPGRTEPPQRLQRGGGSRRPPSGSSRMVGGKLCARPQAAQRGLCRLPCRCNTPTLPARSCKSSTFCVITVSFCTYCANEAMAMWAGLGCARNTFMRRHSYQPQTSSSSLRKASGVAKSLTLKRSHRPVSASRKVAIPLSAETPEPVKTTMCLACCIAAINVCGMEIVVSGVTIFRLVSKNKVCLLVRPDVSHLSFHHHQS